MPLPKRVKVERSAPAAIKPGDRMATNRYGGERGCCPTSTHREKRHLGTSQTRITETITWDQNALNRQTRNFIDHVKCSFCGHEWEQEWCYL